MPFPVDEKYIIAAEQELGAKFPESFRQKMILENGGSIVVDGQVFELYPFYDTSNKKRVKRTCNSIVHETMNSGVRSGISHFTCPLCPSLRMNGLT